MPMGTAPWWEPLFLDGQPQSTTDAQIRCLRAVLPDRARVLDLACGTGRHAVALAEVGFDVVGTDLSDAYVARARARAAEAGVDAAFAVDDMRELGTLADDEFDAVISVYSSFGFLATEEENQRVLAQVARVVRRGGVVVLDLLNRDWVLRELAPSSFAGDGGGDLIVRDFDERADGVVLHEDRFDPITSRLSWRIVRIDGDGDADVAPPRVARLYSLHEVHAMLAAHGLTVTRALGGYDGSPFDVRARRLIVIATV